MVFISSTMGSISTVAGSNAASYRISKAALNMLCKSLSKTREVTSSGVKVISMHPGWVDTDMGSSGGRKPPVSIEQSAKGICDIVLQGALSLQLSDSLKTDLFPGDAADAAAQTLIVSEENMQNIQNCLRSDNCVYVDYAGELLPW